jgi:hypothetical protein
VRVVKSQLTSCLGLLSLMASNAQGMRLTDLALDLRVPKSSTQRLLEHLADAGWVEQDDATSHDAIVRALRPTAPDPALTWPFSHVSRSAARRLHA